MKAHLKSGQHYNARIRLGFFEGIASNAQIVDRLETAGFKNVLVTGSGRDRVASGTWSGQDGEFEVPDQISTIFTG